MAWTAPPTYTAGAILTAAQMNAISANLLAGGPIYATEALRDAAITSPFEGQRAYITGSTVAAATGGTANVPTGIQTIYNGSAWVCTTEVSALTANTGTTASTSYTTTLSGSPGTNPSVTLSTGTTALVSLYAMGYATVQGAGPYLSVAVSGASTIAASDNFSSRLDAPLANYSFQLAFTSVISGLTAGTNTFTLNYRTGSNTGGFILRTLTVKGIA